MIPKLDFLFENDGFHLWTTTDGVVGHTYEIETVDVESEDADQRADQFSDWLRTLDPGLLVKVETRGSVQETFGNGPRAAALRTVGAKSYKTRLTIQTTRNLFRELILKKKGESRKTSELIVQAVKSLKDFGLNVTIDKNPPIFLFHENPKRFSETIGRIDTGESVIGAIRIHRQSAGALNSSSMAYVLAALPPPFRLVTSLRRLPKAQTEILLQRKLKQESSAIGHVFEAKSHAIEETLVETNLSGRDLFEFETTLIIERTTERDLREALAECRPILQSLGDVIVETVGVAPTYAASLPGSGMHLPLLESDAALPLFFPIFRYGESDAETTGAFQVHRRDDSIGEIDLLNRNEQNSNALILGSSGRGKSALLGCLTETLLSDKNVRIIKVDVGGSHSNECELFGGREYRLNLETSSGLNPFELIGREDRTSEAVRSVVSQFIEQLILEEGESRLPKSIRSEVDIKIEEFLRECPELSIDALLSFQEFPRHNLLSRFGSLGLFGRAFQGDGSEGGRTSLRYFNFQDIFQASDPDFAQSAMAAVLAVFNLELRKYPNERLVLVCDETPFFVEKCFDFFKLSTANVRKFGAGVILVAQLSKHLVVRSDTGLIENTHHRFLFSSDGNPDEFASRMSLEERQMELLKSLQFRSRRYSEFLYQRGPNAKAMRLRMSPEEYWRVSSNQSDRMKLANLKRAVPGLTTEEAIRCLSVKEIF